jgi:hypothetical protein
MFRASFYAVRLQAALTTTNIARLRQGESTSMKVSKIGIAAGTFALAASMSLAAPRPASADEGSTAAIAGAAGLVVGALLFDSSSNRYYYGYGRHRRYVSDDEARGYYQRQDPQYYSDHRGEWNNHQQFQGGWDQQHHGRDRGGDRRGDRGRN